MGKLFRGMPGPLVISAFSQTLEYHASPIEFYKMFWPQMKNVIVNSLQFPTKLTPQGKPCCIVRIFEECTFWG